MAKRGSEDLKKLSAMQTSLVRSSSPPHYLVLTSFSSLITRWHFRKHRMTSKCRWLHFNALNKSVRRNNVRSYKGLNWPWMIPCLIKRALLLLLLFIILYTSRPSSFDDQQPKPTLQEQRQAQILQAQLSPHELAYQESLIQEREAEIREIETGIHELQEIFRDLGTLVNQQGGMIGK